MYPTLDYIDQLNSGVVQTRNLMDALAVDFHKLMYSITSYTMPDFPMKIGITKKMQLSAQWLYNKKGYDVLDQLIGHNSDTVRGIACYIIALHDLDLIDRLEMIMPLADDQHFGVREWSQIALKPYVASNTLDAIEILTPWALSPSERVRRFAVEVTRPRGVWCAHIRTLRHKPWSALTMLELLKGDSAKYVQMAVANWLNDAGKDQPQWVMDLCARWSSDSVSEHTRKICKRAMRNLLT